MINHQKLYQNSEDFFVLKGSAVMKLSPDAAIPVCLKATELGLLVACVEGFLVHDIGYESRLDCIWDAKKWLRDDPETNNSLAAEFIQSELSVHGAFIVTLFKKAHNTQMLIAHAPHGLRR